MSKWPVSEWVGEWLSDWVTEWVSVLCLTPATATPRTCILVLPMHSQQISAGNLFYPVTTNSKRMGTSSTPNQHKQQGGAGDLFYPGSPHTARGCWGRILSWVPTGRSYTIMFGKKLTMQRDRPPYIHWVNYRMTGRQGRGSRGGGEGGGGNCPPNFVSQWDGYACAPLKFGNH